MRIISVLSGVMAVIAIACGAFTLGYMYHSYRWAVVGLEMCEMDGMPECHMVREGLEFNVYGNENNFE